MVSASVSFSIAADALVENLTLTGAAWSVLATPSATRSRAMPHNVLTGLGGNDRILGFGGNDSLDGGEGNVGLDGGVGADLMSGGNGNDTYVVDNVGDNVNTLSPTCRRHRCRCRCRTHQVGADAAVEPVAAFATSGGCQKPRIRSLPPRPLSTLRLGRSPGSCCRGRCRHRRSRRRSGSGSRPGRRRRC